MVELFFWYIFATRFTALFVYLVDVMVYKFEAEETISVEAVALFTLEFVVANYYLFIRQEDILI